jgi:hypothetical protein
MMVEHYKSESREAILFRLMEYFTYDGMRKSHPQFDKLDEIAETAWDGMRLEAPYANGTLPELDVAVQFIQTAFEAGDVLMCVRLIHKATAVVTSYITKIKGCPVMDDIAAAMEYVVVQAKPKRFVSMTEYLRRCFVMILGGPHTPELHSIFTECTERTHSHRSSTL